MVDTKKIVDLTSGQKQSHNLSARALSQLSQRIHDIFVIELACRFEELFSDTDDHLFDKSGKSEDSRHFSALRTLRVKKNELTSAFLESIKNGFLEALGKGGQTLSENEPEEGSFESLSLVEEDDLEERIALDSMSSKALKNNKLALDNICKRLDVITPNKLIHEENNPMSPDIVTGGFSQCLSTVDLDTEFKLVLYKFFERSVIDELDLVYEKINQLFIEEGVLPDLKLAPVKQRDKERSHSQNNEVENEQVQMAPSETSQMESSSLESKEVLNLLGELLSQRRGNNAPSPVPQQVDTQQLVNVLSALQVQVVSSENQESLTNQLRDIRAQIGSRISGEVDGQLSRGALGQANDDMIDVVTMLFDFILDDENLQAEIKAIIARLQIPILKVGITDKTFFSNRKHSARLLLNELAHSGLSWDPEDKSSLPMLTKIQQVVERICNEYSEQVDFFDNLLEEFLAFKSEFRRRAGIFEKRTREAEEGKAKAETARSKVNEEIKRICRRKSIPQIGKQIFKNVWSHVMFLESLREDSENWDKVAKIAQMLVWSLQPKKDQESLNKLKRIIPRLVKNLKLGFSKISYSQIDSSRLLDQLEVEHRKIIDEAKAYIEESEKDEIIRLKPKSLLELSEPEPIEEPAKEEVVEEVELEEVAFTAEETGAPTESAKRSTEISQDSLQAVDGFSAGSWFDLKIGEEYRRTKLAARIVSTGKFIFVNRSGVKVAEFYTEEIAAAYQLGEIRVLDDEALFDRALKAVISNLREMKAES